LRKACKASPTVGVIIVYDAIIGGGCRENVFGLLMSVNMLIETPGGSRGPRFNGGRATNNGVGLPAGARIRLVPQ
jgi:hypothetical protein